MKKTGARMGIKGVAAVILAILWVSAGPLWGQGPPLTGGRVTDSPRQADKSYTQDQQKKRQQQIGKKGQKPQTQKKGRQQGAGSATQSQPPTKPMRGGPVGPAGK